MEETTQNSADYGLVEGNSLAKAAKQNPLSLLFDQQDKTRHLLQVLGEKLQPVANPHPVDSKAQADRGYHIETALYNQQDINQAISYLIDTLVV